MSAPPGSPTLHQGLADLRQTWEHLARELAGGVPELPGIIDQELAGLSLPDLNEETLIRVTEGVVARVAAAGFPDEASTLFRRMGRAMYELLLLLATQEEIRGMGTKQRADLGERSRPTVAPPAPAPCLPPDTAGTQFRPGGPAATIAAPPAAVKPAPSRPTARPEGVTAPAPALDLAVRVGPKAAPRPGQAPALAEVGQTRSVTARDPARPDPPGIGPTALPVRVEESSPAPGPQAADIRPAPPGSATAKAPVVAVDQTPALELAPLLPLEEARAVPSAPPAPAALAQPPPPVPATAQAPPPAPAAKLEPTPTVSPASAPTGQVRAPARTPGPAGREQAESEASLWGFDPANRESPVVEEVAADPVPAPVAGPGPAVPAAAPAAAPTSTPVAELEPRPADSPESSWTVRLSPRSATERDRRLQAREAQLPLLVEEIVATAKSQQAGLSSRGAARRVLAAAKEALPVAAGADPSEKILALLESGNLEDAVAQAVQVAETVRGEKAAALVCAVGEGAKQAKQVELAVLCFTSAVLCAPPCDRACWQLCTLSVERRDAELAPLWLEYVARLLRSRGADADSISVYRQLLRLAPRRSDIRELLRTSSLTGVLPD